MNRSQESFDSAREKLMKFIREATRFPNIQLPVADHECIPNDCALKDLMEEYSSFSFLVSVN